MTLSALANASDTPTYPGIDCRADTSKRTQSYFQYQSYVGPTGDLLTLAISEVAAQRISLPSGVVIERGQLIYRNDRYNRVVAQDPKYRPTNPKYAAFARYRLASPDDYGHILLLPKNLAALQEKTRFVGVLQLFEEGAGFAGSFPVHCLKTKYPAPKSAK